MKKYFLQTIIVFITIFLLSDITDGKSIAISNASFEAPVTDPKVNYGAWPFIDDWTEIDMDPDGLSTNTGVFPNTEPNHISPFSIYLNPFSTDPVSNVHDHIFNADGKQLAFLGSQTGNVIEQDLSAIYEVGCDYHLTVAVKLTLLAPINPLIELVLYYHDGSEPVDIVSAAIPAVSWSQMLEDFSVYLPKVDKNDPWAGKNIGIAIRAIGDAGGFWDLDNVRLEKTYPISIDIENASFELPVVDPNNNYGALPYIDGWIEKDIDPSGMSTNTGVFANTEPNHTSDIPGFEGIPDHIFNADGKQLVFLCSQQGNALEQDLAATYNVGCDYHLTVALGVSLFSPGDPLDLVLYYLDDNEPIDIASVTIPALARSQWLKDFTLSLRTVDANDPWAGKTIGIAIRASGVSGGFWDIDNVRLAESMPFSVQIKNASFEEDANSATAWEEIDLGTPSNTGIFTNDPNSSDYIINADGGRLAFLQCLQGVALEQDLAATYNTGCAYRLTVAVGIEIDSPPVDALEISLYYFNYNNQQVDIGWPVEITPMSWSRQLKDVSFYLSSVGPIDGLNWAGKKIGIAIRATGTVGGFWNLDNVRLAESFPIQANKE